MHVGGAWGHKVAAAAIWAALAALAPAFPAAASHGGPPGPSCDVLAQSGFSFPLLSWSGLGSSGDLALIPWRDDYQGDDSGHEGNDVFPVLTDSSGRPLGDSAHVNYNAPVVAASTGQVTDLGTKAGFGNYVYITRADGYTYHYAHLRDTPSTYLTQWQLVLENTVINYAGRTGNAVGTHVHLHFEIEDSFLMEHCPYRQLHDSYRRPGEHSHDVTDGTVWGAYQRSISDLGFVSSVYGYGNLKGYSNASTSGLYRQDFGGGNWLNPMIVRTSSAHSANYALEAGEVHGSIANRYRSLFAAGNGIGGPSSYAGRGPDEYPWGIGQRQDFGWNHSRSSLMNRTGVGTFWGRGLIWSAYQGFGAGATGGPGFPTADRSTLSGNGSTGYVQGFEARANPSSPLIWKFYERVGAAQAYEVHGNIRVTYDNAGGVRSAAGWPVGNEATTSDGRPVSFFQYRCITRPPGSSTYSLYLKSDPVCY